MSTITNVKASGPIAASVWLDTNRVTSDAKVKDVTLDALFADAQDATGTWAKIDGRTKLGGIFKWDPFATTSLPPETKEPDGYDPYGSEYPGGFSKAAPMGTTSKRGNPTNDGFDQVQLYSAITGMQLYLVNLGFDVAAMIGKRHNGKQHAVSAHANAVNDLNAWYSPQSDDLTFGTSDDEWHLAADNDVSIHESGHLLLDHINKGLSGWYAGEGGAIHEGFGDAMAALIANDAEVSEDFPPAMGEPADKGVGLRTASNNLTLAQVGDEVHDRGQVYAGFWWSLKGRLEKLGKPAREAADIALRVMVNHASFYKTTKPKPADFVKAVIAGAKGLDESGGNLGVPFETIKQEIVAEAIARGMIKKAGDAETRTKKKKALLSDRDVLDEIGALSSRISFTSSGTVQAKGGSREEYQEWFATADGVKARVIGGGFSVHRDAQNQADVATEDIRVLKAGDINEARTINAAAAFRVVQGRAAKELMVATQEKQKIEKMAVRTKKDRHALKKAQAGYRIALAATQKLGRLEAGAGQLVVLPGENELAYEFKMGLSLYYVNARTGTVRVESDVLWD